MRNRPCFPSCASYLVVPLTCLALLGALVMCSGCAAPDGPSAEFGGEPDFVLFSNYQVRICNSEIVRSQTETSTTTTSAPAGDTTKPVPIRWFCPPPPPPPRRCVRRAP